MAKPAQAQDQQSAERRAKAEQLIKQILPGFGEDHFLSRLNELVSTEANNLHNALEASAFAIQRDGVKSFTIYSGSDPFLKVECLSDTPAPCFTHTFASALQQAAALCVDLAQLPKPELHKIRDNLKERLDGIDPRMLSIVGCDDRSYQQPPDVAETDARIMAYVLTRLPQATADLLQQLHDEAALTMFGQGNGVFAEGLKDLDSMQRQLLRERVGALRRGGSSKFYKDITPEQQRELSEAYDTAKNHFAWFADMYRDGEGDVDNALRYARSLIYRGSEHAVDDWLIKDFRKSQSSDSSPYRLAHYLAATLAGLGIRHTTGEKRKGELISLETIEEQRKIGDALRGVSR